MTRRRAGFNLRQAAAACRPDLLRHLPAQPSGGTLYDRADDAPAAPAPAATRQRFALVLEAGDDALGRPPAQRLRMLLKIAGRGLSLRCLSVAAHDAANPAEGSP
jgi:hypothetical protein